MALRWLSNRFRGELEDGTDSNWPSLLRDLRQVAASALRAEDVVKTALLAYVWRWRVRRWTRHAKQLSLGTQSLWRRHVARSAFRRVKTAATTIQAFVRRNKVRLSFLATRRNVTSFQAVVRGVIARAFPPLTVVFELDGEQPPVSRFALCRLGLVQASPFFGLGNLKRGPGGFERIVVEAPHPLTTDACAGAVWDALRSKTFDLKSCLATCTSVGDLLGLLSTLSMLALHDQFDAVCAAVYTPATSFSSIGSFSTPFGVPELWAIDPSDVFLLQHFSPLFGVPPLRFTAEVLAHMVYCHTDAASAVETALRDRSALEATSPDTVLRLRWTLETGLALVRRHVLVPLDDVAPLVPDGVVAFDGLSILQRATNAWTPALTAAMAKHGLRWGRDVIIAGGAVVRAAYAKSELSLATPDADVDVFVCTGGANASGYDATPFRELVEATAKALADTPGVLYVAARVVYSTVTLYLVEKTVTGTPTVQFILTENPTASCVVHGFDLDAFQGAFWPTHGDVPASLSLTSACIRAWSAGAAHVPQVPVEGSPTADLAVREPMVEPATSPMKRVRVPAVDGGEDVDEHDAPMSELTPADVLLASVAPPMAPVSVLTAAQDTSSVRCARFAKASIKGFRVPAFDAMDRDAKTAALCQAMSYFAMPVDADRSPLRGACALRSAFPTVRVWTSDMPVSGLRDAMSSMTAMFADCSSPNPVLDRPRKSIGPSYDLPGAGGTGSELDGAATDAGTATVKKLGADVTAFSVIDDGHVLFAHCSAKETALEAKTETFGIQLTLSTTPNPVTTVFRLPGSSCAFYSTAKNPQLFAMTFESSRATHVAKMDELCGDIFHILPDPRNSRSLIILGKRGAVFYHTQLETWGQLLEIELRKVPLGTVHLDAKELWFVWETSDASYVYRKALTKDRKSWRAMLHANIVALVPHPRGCVEVYDSFLHLRTFEGDFLDLESREFTTVKATTGCALPNGFVVCMSDGRLVVYAPSGAVLHTFHPELSRQTARRASHFGGDTLCLLLSSGNLVKVSLPAGTLCVDTEASTDPFADVRSAVDTVRVRAASSLGYTSTPLSSPFRVDVTVVWERASFEDAPTTLRWTQLKMTVGVPERTGFGCLVASLGASYDMGNAKPGEGLLPARLMFKGPVIDAFTFAPAADCFLKNAWPVGARLQIEVTGVAMCKFRSDTILRFIVSHATMFPGCGRIE